MLCTYYIISIIIMSIIGMIFSVIFMILQLVPIPGLSGVNFGKESYLMLIVWIVLGVLFFPRKGISEKKETNHAE